MQGPAKPRGIFYWSCKERRTRHLVAVPLSDLPAFATAFQTPPPPPLADAAADGGAVAAGAGNAVAEAAAADNAPMQVNEEDHPDFNDDDDAEAGDEEGAEILLLLDQKTKDRLLAEEGSRSRLNILTAAGLFGGWWGPAAEQDDQAARQMVRGIEWSRTSIAACTTMLDRLSRCSRCADHLFGSCKLRDRQSGNRMCSCSSDEACIMQLLVGLSTAPFHSIVAFTAV